MIFNPYIRRAWLVESMGPKAVYDGDGTLHLDIDQGFYIKRFTIKARVNRIDAPELTGGNKATRAAGRAARDFLYSLLSAQPNGFWINSKAKGKYGRWLVEIWLDDGLSLIHI